MVERDGVVAFVEVKTRRPNALAPAATAVNWRKRRQIGAAAAVAAERWGDRATGFRFDVVTIQWGPHGPVLDHLEDAFRLER